MIDGRLDRMSEPMKPNAQMIRLRETLDDAGIQWLDDSDWLMCRTKSTQIKTVVERGTKVGRAAFSVISGPYSYGGQDGLEAWMAEDAEPCGYETADEVFELIREAIGL